MPKPTPGSRTTDLTDQASLLSAAGQRPTLGRRVADALRYVFGGAGGSDAWMGPLTPVQPSVPGSEESSVRGRQFDYPVGYNVRIQPRSGEEVTFSQLRGLADSCDLLRLVIETRKDQLCKLRWTFKPRDQKKSAEGDKRVDELINFFSMPDGEHDWQTWLRALVEDMLVIDAASVYPWLLANGTPYRLELVDGATITRKLDARGRTPPAPATAYQQVLKGVPVADYSSNELVYAVRNYRTNRVYGYSPVEQIILTVNIAIRRALHQLQYYTEGSTPDLLFQVPADWQMEQIKQFNDWWQQRLAGNTAERRQVQFLPNGVQPYDVKQNAIKDEYDEWLARVICYAFSVSPQWAAKMMNRATAETQQEMAAQEGLLPLQLWVKNLVDRIVRQFWGYQDIEFAWEEEDATDPLTQAKIHDTKVRNGTMTIDEVRGLDGQDPYPDGRGSVPMVLTSTGYVPLATQQERDATAEAAQQARDQLAAGGDPVKPSKDGEETPPDDEPPEQKMAKGTGKRLQPPDQSHRPEIEKKLSAVLADFFRQQAKQLVADLTKADDPNLHFGEIADPVITLLVETVEKGAKSAYIEINLDDQDALNQANERAVAWADKRGAELVGMRRSEDGSLVPNPKAEYNIAETTREMVRATIKQAEEQGWSNERLAKELEESYAFSEQRAEMIARTETAMADVQGNLAMYEASGVVNKLEWLTGAGCCDQCSDLNGKTTKLGGTFPGGYGPPPLHPNCRCDVLPVLDEDE